MINATAERNVSTNEVASNLRLAKKVLFESFEIECYEDVSRDNGDFFMTRKQISDALEYENDRSFHMVVTRKQEKIGNPVVNKLLSADGKAYNTELYTFEQFFELIDGNRQPKAELFRKWAILTLKELVTGRAELKFNKKSDQLSYEANISKIVEESVNKAVTPILTELGMTREENARNKNEIIKLTETISNIDKKFKVSYNKSALFEKLKVDFLSTIKYNDTTNYTKFYRELENWLGYKFPYSSNTKQWILKNIHIDVIEEFVNGVIIGRIIKSKRDNWVDLSGVYENQVEFEKVKNNFDNSCSYCGKKTNILDIEHIFCQSNPKSTDRIYNILCACKDCNKSKYNNSITEWYKAQPFFTEERWEAICEHWRDYEVEITL